MGQMKVRIPKDWKDDLSYYPGLNHSGDIEIEFAEYIWSIHKLIDDSVQNNYMVLIQAKTYMSAGYVFAPYVFAPYIPLMSIPATGGAYVSPIKQTIVHRVSNLIQKGKLYV